MVARVFRPGPFAITRSGLQSFDLGLDGGLALASRIAQVLVVGFRLVGPLLRGADLGVDRLDRLLEDDRGRLDRIDCSLRSSCPYSVASCLKASAFFVPEATRASTRSYTS